MYFLVQRSIALFGLLVLSPILGILYVLVKSYSNGPFLFKQQRSGKNKKPFTIYKIRTMYVGAENHQRKYKHLNEADDPVFKIKNDPRFTSFGRWLAHTGLDELPQLINIVKGEMAFVGPRPLPVSEANQVPKKYHKRFSVPPGITSLWVVNGSHQLTFREWMELDMVYVQKKSVLYDIQIAQKTAQLFLHINFPSFHDK